MSKQNITVPDIGDYSDVPVIEVLVKVGDVIEKEQALLVLESDKATMEVPADQAGKILSLSLKVGDKVSKGSIIAEIESSGAVSPVAAPAPGGGRRPEPRGRRGWPGGRRARHGPRPWATGRPPAGRSGS